MKGIHHIIVSNGSMKYEFDLKRNITILRGNSATGKTTLIEMIQEYLVNGADSGVNFSCDVPCRVLTGNLWKEQIPVDREAILFIDEGNRFVKTQEFAEVVKKSGNYYVIVTRESLEMLPISVNEIYGIKSSGKYGGLTPVYHEFYKIYDMEKDESYPICPEQIVVEDSNSGFDFFNKLAEEKGIICITANGKSNIYNWLCENTIHVDTLIVADGAAFGSQMSRIESIVKRNKKIHLYLPESFEWLLLKADLFKSTYVNQVLENPEKYVEYKEFFSWEQFFTSFLIEISKNGYLRYSKQKLNSNYLQEGIRNKIKAVMEKIEI